LGPGPDPPGLSGGCPIKTAGQPGTNAIRSLISDNPRRVPGRGQPLRRPPSGRAKGDAKATVARRAHAPCRAARAGRNWGGRYQGSVRGSKSVSSRAGRRGLSMGDLQFQPRRRRDHLLSRESNGPAGCRKVDIIKRRVANVRQQESRVQARSPITPNQQDYIDLRGISVDEAGQQHTPRRHMPIARHCLRDRILKKFGCRGHRPISIPRPAPCQGPKQSPRGRLPNACATRGSDLIFRTSTSARLRGPTPLTATARCRSRRTSESLRERMA